MRWPCPRCVETIKVSLNARSDFISCPHCKARYSLVELERLSNRRDRLTRLSGYRIGQFLGSGEFADVFQGVDESNEQVVAIKIPRTDSLEQRTFLQREMRATARLQHPNIVRVQKLLREADRTFIVCDLVPGQPLDAWSQRQHLSHEAAARLCAVLADALQHAHSKGVVHRDLKPSNVIISPDGQPHITDFGLALCESDPKLMSHERHQQALLLIARHLDDPRKAAVFGTPAYMAPEQARGEPATALSDVYSLGAILYELLTGVRPFRGDLRAVLRQVVRDRPTRPRSLKRGIPPDLETICLKAMAKRRSRRYASAQAMADDCRRFIDGQPVEASPPSKLILGWEFVRHNPVEAVALVFVVSAFIVGVAFLARL